MLRDDILLAVLDHGNFVTDANEATDIILAAVRRHIEPLPDEPHNLGGMTVKGAYRRAVWDVLMLLDKTDKWVARDDDERVAAYDD